MHRGPRLSSLDVPPDVEIAAAETPHDGFFRLDRYTVRHRTHAGGWSPPLTREVLERGHAVAVLLHDPAADAVVLVRQFRLPAVAAGKAAWQTEAVAGMIEPGEDPDAVARREVREECGHEPTALRLVHHVLVSPGGTTETVRIYVAEVDSSATRGIHGVAAENEDIAPVVLGLDVALARVADGTIDNAPAVIALQWLALNRRR